MFDAAPEGTVAAVRFSSLNALEADIETFMRSTVGLGAPGMVEALLLNAIGIPDRTGMDADARVWAFIQPQGSDDMQICWLVPMSDQGEFLTRIGARRMGEDAVYSYQDMVIVPNGTTAVLIPEEDADALLAWAQSEVIPLLAEVSAGDGTQPLEAQVPNGSMMAWCNDLTWFEALGDAVPEMPAPAVQPSGVTAYLEPVFALLASVLWDEVAEAEQVEISLNVGSDGVAAGVALQTSQGTVLNEYVQTLQDHTAVPMMMGGELYMEKSTNRLHFPLPQPYINRLSTDLETLGVNAEIRQTVQDAFQHIFNGDICHVRYLPEGSPYPEYLVSLGLADESAFTAWVDRAVSYLPTLLTGLMKVDGYRVQVIHDNRNNDAGIGRISFILEQGEASSPPSQELIDSLPILEYRIAEALDPQLGRSVLVRAGGVGDVREGLTMTSREGIFFSRFDLHLPELLSAQLAMSGAIDRHTTQHPRSEGTTLTFHAEGDVIHGALVIPSGEIGHAFEVMLMGGVMPLSGFGPQ